MRRRAAQVERLHAVLVDLEDQDRGGLHRTAAGRGIDDRERVEKRVDDVDHEQEEGRRRQHREDDRPETAGRTGAVDRGRLDQRFRDRLQAGQEEQEVVADLLPHGGDHDQDQRLPRIEQVIPVVAQRAQQVGYHAKRRIEQEQPEHGGDRRRDGVGPDQQRLVHLGAANDAVGEDGEQQRHGETDDGDQDGEYRRDLERRQVTRVVEQVAEVVEPDELRPGGERVLDQQRPVHRLARRPEEKDQRDDELRCDKRVRQPRRLEDDALFHPILVGTTPPRKRGGASTDRRNARPCRC